MERSTGALTYINTPAQLWDQTGEDVELKKERMRANDGNIDPQGRFWVGMMNDGLVVEGEPEAEGAVFVLWPDGTVRRAIDQVAIPNGIGWSSDGKTMYFSDSTVKTVWSYDFDGKSGTMSNKRAWWEIPADYPEDAVPDGFCQDVEGGIWVAVHGAARVVRLMDNGHGKAEVLGQLTLPTRCPTCPRLVGTEIYLTSHEETNPDQFPESVKLAGAVFKVDVGVRGINMNKWEKE